MTKTTTDMGEISELSAESFFKQVLAGMLKTDVDVAQVDIVLSDKNKAVPDTALKFSIQLVAINGTGVTPSGESTIKANEAI